LEKEILNLCGKKEFDHIDFDIFNAFLEGLNKGIYRAAEQSNGEWITNTWVKKGILLGFRMGKLIAMKDGYIDKHTYPVREFSPDDMVRVVPGGTSIRQGAYLARTVVVMPPSYINVGAYIDEGSLIDSHSLVGSCAQVGKNVHLSAGAMLGGVLEPINANPVIIEDNVFIGGNSGIFEGVIVRKNAIIAAGVIITGSTPVYDAVNNDFIHTVTGRSLTIPENAVVVPGSRRLRDNETISLHCPVIIKYRDEKSDRSVQLEKLLR